MLSTCSLQTRCNQNAGRHRALTCRCLASLQPLARHCCPSRTYTRFWSAARSSTMMVVMKGKSHKRRIQESSICPLIPFTSSFHQLEEVDQHQTQELVFSLEFPLSSCVAHSGRLPEARLTDPADGGRKATVVLPFLTATAGSSFLQHSPHHSRSDEGSTEPESCTCLRAFKPAENRPWK